jgi:hypothetical protein
MDGIKNHCLYSFLVEYVGKCLLFQQAGNHKKAATYRQASLDVLEEILTPLDPEINSLSDNELIERLK